MTQYVINIGAIPNDGTGDPLRTAFNETNLNFDQVFVAGPVLSNIQIANNKILTTNTNGNLVLAPNGTGVVQSNVSIVPNLANLRNLGSSTQRWSTVYTQYLNATQINLAGDLTVAGNLTVQGNIIQIGNIVTDSLTIQLANTASNASSANGAGITVGVNDNIATILYNSTGNVWTTNIGVSSVGNISAPYFIGNGSQLTGLAATYGNANVVTLLAEFGSNNISTTGNVRSNNISTTGNITSNGLVNINSLRVNQTANAWVISGNTISAPSGAFWNSDQIFKDEYITSALDGYINLTSRYANGNTASQVHLEHGLAQIVVDNGSEYIWAFDDTGNMTLPGNSFAVNYANGNPVSLGGNYGNSNVTTLLAEFGSNNISTTGNVRSNNISTTGNITSNGLVNINSLRVNQTANAWVISGNTISAPSGAFWNSNVVSKDEYINSALDGYINLQSLYANSNVASQIHLEHGLAQIVVDNGAEYIWSFGATGNLTLPGNTFAVNYANGTSVSIGAGGGLPVANGTSNFDIATANGNVTITANASSTWTFGTNESLTLPGGSQLSPLGANLDIIAGTGAYVNLTTSDESSSMGVDNGGGYIVTAGGTWDFDTTGNLTAPGNISATGNISSGNLTVGSGTITGGNVNGSIFNGNVAFGTGTVGGSGNITGGNISAIGNITGNTAGFTIGYRDIPQVSFTGNANIATTDAGKHFYSTQSTNYTLTIANNASQGFQIGAAITVINQGTGNITVAQGSGVTLYLAGNATSGNRSVATFGMATLIKVATDTWFINGTGVS